MRRLWAPAAYLALALVAVLPALGRLSTMTPCACYDPPQTDWFLAWTPHALVHAISPWFSRAVNVPAGVNLMWNTLMPLPGLLAAPVTWAVNVLAAHTLLTVFAFWSAAVAAWWAVGPWVRWPVARFAAGLVYGFSPYLVAQGSQHLNLALVATPPLLWRLLHEVLVRQRRPWWQTGAAVGLVALAQLLTSEEVLATELLVASCGLLVLLWQHRRRLGPRVGPAARGLGLAAAVLTVGAAWPLWVQFFGPQRVLGPVQHTDRYAADLLGLVVPTVNQLLGSRASLSYAVNPLENGSYLGVPLLVVLVLLAVRWWREGVVRFAVVLGVATWVLSLGTRLHVAGPSTGVPLPWAALGHLPVLHDISPVRLSVYGSLCAAVLLGVGVDRWHWSGALRRPVAPVLAGLCLLTLLPAWPYHFEPARVPSYFTDGGVDRVPAGSVVVSYPVPRFPRSAPMVWQALTGFRYATLGGYVITPRRDGRGTFFGGFTQTERLFAANEAGRVLPPVTPARRAALLDELHRLNVTVVLLAQAEAHAGSLQVYLTQLFGRPPDGTDGGVSAWYGLPA